MVAQGPKTSWADEVALATRRAPSFDRGGAAAHDPGLGGEAVYPGAHVAELGGGGDRAHGDVGVGGVPHAAAGELVGDGVRERGGVVGGDEDAADGGALLAGLLGHVGHDISDREVPQGVAGPDVGAEDGAVERVGFDVDADGSLDRAGHGADAGACGGRAGEGDDVVGGEVVE